MSWKNLFLTFASTAILALSFSASANNGNGQLADFRHADKPVAGQYIVVLKDEVASLAREQQRTNLPAVAQVANNMARSSGMRVEKTFEHALRGFVVSGNERALMRLLRDERIAFVEEDGYISINQTTQPNATWGLDRIDQRDLPLDGTYTYDTTASNVYTYIVDTGVRPTHNDFGNRVTSGFTSINDGRGSNDCNGHGTHVAGTVAGSTWGVAKSAVIVPVRVLDCQGGGTSSGVIAGMDWVAANHTKPAVANMSLGGGASTATDNAVTNMRNAGVTVVVAAGNENQNACNVSPARSANAITVGSTTNNDSRSNFSNWGSCVDIFAPGSSITSAWHTSNSATNTISGTSMAAPHVAGIAAIYLADNPNATPGQVESAVYDIASTGKLSGLNGSPNLLAYSRFGDGDGDGGTEPEPGELENGVAVSNLSGSQGSETFFTLDVPEGAEDLVIEISGGSGDADLYVRHGAAPTQSTYDCRPYLSGNEETCSFDNPQAGTWHVMIHGWQAYSGLTLVASYEVPVTVTELDPGVPVGNLSGSQGSETFFTMEVPDGAEDLVFEISGGSGDADLYVRRGAPPTTSTYDCRPFLAGNNETCTFDDPQAGTWHVMIRGYEAYSGVTLVGDYEEPSSSNELSKGVPVTGLSGQQGSEVFFTIEVPDGATDLIVDMSGGTGDADLYVRHGAPPTTSSYDCRPYLSGNDETCTFASPQAGTWHVMIRGWQAYSGVTLVADYTEPSSAPCTNCDQYSSSLNSGAQEQQPDGTYYYSSAGVHRGWLQGPSNANFDLRLYRWSGSSWQMVASSTSGNSEEHIEYNGSAGHYTWLVNSVSGSGSYDFWLQQP